MLSTTFNLPRVSTQLERYGQHIHPLNIASLLITLIGLGCALTFSTTSRAELPAPILEALAKANIDTDDVSMIITPVKQLSYSSTEQQDLSSNSPNSISVLSLQVPKDYEGSSSTPQDMTPLESIQNGDTTPVGQLLTLPIRHRTDVPRTPASVMKLIPTFVALDMLGPDFRWITHVYHTGLINDNTLYGDLIIKGSGDPKMTHQRLAMLLSQVKRFGIEHIQGDIVIDTSVFQDVSKRPDRFDKQPLRPYNVSPDGFLVNFNSIKLTAIIPPNSTETNFKTAYLYYTPKLADYTLPKQIGTHQGGCGSIKSSLAPVWQEHSLALNKKLPVGCNLNTFYIAYPDVKEFAKKVVKQKWLELGNTLSGNIISTEYPRYTRLGNYLSMNAVSKNHPETWRLAESFAALPLPMVSYASPPLSQQIYDINHHSNNVMTEQITLSLPLYGQTHDHGVKNDVTFSNYPRALDTLSGWWQTHLTTSPPYMTNGSGLCRQCTVTADNIAELLEYAYHHPHFDIFLDSLGIAGIDGTIKDHAKRMPNSSAIGQAWIKTGTLDNVTAMAGYVHGDSRQDYIVVGIINTPYKLNTDQARFALDTMLDWTAKH